MDRSKQLDRQADKSIPCSIKRMDETETFQTHIAHDVRRPFIEKSGHDFKAEEEEEDSFIIEGLK